MRIRTGSADNQSGDAPMGDDLHNIRPRSTNTDSLEARAGGRKAASLRVPLRDKPDTHSTGDALCMLDLFGSVGVEAVDLTFTDIDGHHIRAQYRRAVSIDTLQRRVDTILAAAASTMHNVIIRPTSTDAFLLQLDDLDESAVQAVKPIAFMIIATSPGNHQAWLAFAKSIDKQFARSLRLGVGADLSASGATRLAGSLNFKTKYAPDFPRVAIVHSQPGRLTTSAEVEGLNLLAPEEPPHVRTRRLQPRRSGPKPWPSYERCLQGAPMNRDGTERDISVCDFTWCLIAIDWGWPPDQAADRLMLESRKAQVEGPAYARRTADRAAEVITARPPQCPSV